MSYDIYKNMSTEDLYTLRNNKEGWASAATDAEKQKYNDANNAIRDKYNISREQDVPLYTLNDYIKTYDDQIQKEGLLHNITQPNMQKTNEAAEKLNKFQYNPESDPVYQAYREMYQRQGTSAQKSTINELNSKSMGRNTSYSAAAAAQVGQAYAQKAYEIVPTLAEQAYNKLLQQYNIAKDADDTHYNRNLQSYQALVTNEQNDLQAQNMRYANESAKLQLEALPEQLRIDIESGRLTNLINTENLTQAQIATLIQQKYGMLMAEAQYVASTLANDYTKLQMEGQRLDNTYRGKQIANFNTPSSKVVKDEDDGKEGQKELVIKNNCVRDSKGNVSWYWVDGVRLSAAEIEAKLENGTAKFDPVTEMVSLVKEW